MRPSGDANLLWRKGSWTAEADILLKNYVQKHGEGKWHLVPLKTGLNRCRKSCRLRWINYLNPNIKRGDFEEDEVDLILRLHKLLGNKWSLIAGRLPRRTANDIKNYWNTHLRPRPIQRKQDLKDCKLSQHAPVPVMRPQPRTISKTLNFYPHIETHDAGPLIASSNKGFDNACNTSVGLVSSPTVSDEMINEYLERDGSDGVEKEDRQSTLFNFPTDDVMWDFLHSKHIEEDQTYK